MRLYDIAKKYDSLLFKLEQDEEFELEAELDATEELLEEKLEACAAMFRNLELEAECYRQEVLRLEKKMDSRKDAAIRLKKYIGYCLHGQPCKTKNFNLSFRESQQVEVINLEIVPDAYIRTVTKHEPNKELMKQELKAGVEIPGVGLLKNYSLQIK